MYNGDLMVRFFVSLIGAVCDLIGDPACPLFYLYGVIILFMILMVIAALKHI